MGKQAPSAPPIPNPYDTARAQTGSNVQTAIANSILGNANEISPYGRVSYRQIGTTRIGGPGNPASPGGPGGPGSPGAGFGNGPGGGGGGGGFGNDFYDIPQFERTVELSPEQQRLYDQQTQLGGRLNDLALGQTRRLQDVLSTPFDPQGLPERASLDGDFSEDRKRVEDALFARLNPQLDRDRSSLENNLINQGFQRGTEAFTNAMDEQSRASNDARLGVIAQGGGEQERLFNMALNRANFNNTSRQQAFQEALALRNQPINEISALMSGGQVTAPQFAQYQGGQVAGTPVGEYIYQGANLANQQYAQQMQRYNAGLGGLFGLGQMGLYGALRYSDRALKNDIRDIGIRLMNGLKLYAYRYLWETKERIGVMADEVKAIKPGAVVDIGGFDAVNYAEVV